MYWFSLTWARAGVCSVLYIKYTLLLYHLMVYYIWCDIYKSCVIYKWIICVLYIYIYINVLYDVLYFGKTWKNNSIKGTFWIEVFFMYTSHTCIFNMFLGKSHSIHELNNMKKNCQKSVPAPAFGYFKSFIRVFCQPNGA